MGAFGGSLTGGLAGLAPNVLGSTGLGTLVSSLPISSIAGGLSLTGVAPVLGTVFNGLGFPGVTNIVQGVTTLVPGLTTGTGLSLTGAFQGLSGVASALGIPGTTDLTALGSIVSAVEGGTLGVNEMVNVLTGVTQVAGFTPPGEVNQIPAAECDCSRRHHIRRPAQRPDVNGWPRPRNDGQRSRQHHGLALWRQRPGLC